MWAPALRTFFYAFLQDLVWCSELCTRNIISTCDFTMQTLQFFVKQNNSQPILSWFCLVCARTVLALHCVHIDKTFETMTCDEKNLLRHTSQTIDAPMSHTMLRTYHTNWRHIVIIIMWIYSFKRTVFFSLSFFVAFQPESERRKTELPLRSFRRNKVSFRFTSNNSYWLQFQHSTNNFTKNANCLNDSKWALSVFINATPFSRSYVRFFFTSLLSSTLVEKMWLLWIVYAKDREK